MGEFRRLHARIGQSLAGSLEAKVRGVLVISQFVALSYARAGDNPLVVGVHHPGEVFVGQDRVRHMGAQRKQMAERIHSVYRRLDGAGEAGKLFVGQDGLGKAAVGPLAHKSAAHLDGIGHSQ